jgi:hypothetical protein
MRGVDSLPQNLRDVEIRGAGDERGHHESYRQYDLGPAAHITERLAARALCNRADAQRYLWLLHFLGFFPFFPFVFFAARAIRARAAIFF